MTAASINEEVVQGMRDLAARRGWKSVEDLAAAILSRRTRREILLAHGAGVDATPLRNWMQQTADPAEITEAPIGEIAAPPFSAWFATKLVAVFECGRALDAAAATAIAEQFLTRPLESFAIVFTHAERLKSPEDLDQMERAIWRLVVPDPKREWQRQDLLAYQCYLWSASEPNEFLRDRCRRDAEELAALLRRPLADPDVELLDRAQVSRLLDFAEGFTPATHPARDGDAGRLRRARVEVAEVRSRVARRMDGDAASLSAQVAASLLALEQDLLRRIEKVREGQSGLWKDTHVYSRKFQSLLEKCIEEGMTSWRLRLEVELDQRVAGIILETQTLLDRIDWDFVHAMAGNPARPAAVSLRIPVDPHAPALEHTTSGPEWQDRVTGVVALFGLAAALSTGLVATVAVSSLLAALGIARRGQSFEQSAQAARQAIHAMTRQAIPESRTAIQGAIAEYRDRLAAELSAIETTLDAAYAQAMKVPDGDSAAELDRAQLLLYRQRL